MRFQWNALRVGDHVDVHDPGDADLRLVTGVVTIVQSRRGANDIGIRLGGVPGIARAAPTGGHVVRPARRAVHLDATDAARGCWRCARATSSAQAHA